MENITRKKEFIEFCNEIEEENIYPDDILYTSQCLLKIIYNMYIIGNSEDFDNEMFEIVTRKKILEIIDEGVSYIFYKAHLNHPIEYIDLSLQRSGLQFLFDYAMCYGNDEDVKKCLKEIMISDFIEDITEKLDEFKNRSDLVPYLKGNIGLPLTHIPISHYWWKRDY